MTLGFPSHPYPVYRGAACAAGAGRYECRGHRGSRDDRKLPELSHWCPPFECARLQITASPRTSRGRGTWVRTPRVEAPIGVAHPVLQRNLPPCGPSVGRGACGNGAPSRLIQGRAPAPLQPVAGLFHRGWRAVHLHSAERSLGGRSPPRAGLRRVKTTTPTTTPITTTMRITTRIVVSFLEESDEVDVEPAFPKREGARTPGRQ